MLCTNKIKKTIIALSFACSSVKPAIPTPGFVNITPGTTDRDIKVGNKLEGSLNLFPTSFFNALFQAIIIN